MAATQTAPKTPSISRTAMLILLAIGPEERHGYAIMREVSDITGGATKLGPGAVYTTIKRLLGDALIEETEDRPDPEMDDQRRRYYRLTGLGRAAVATEARRLEAPGRLRPTLGVGVEMTRKNGQLRIYRGLLSLYPSAYRKHYGEKMVQLFGDQIRDEGAMRAWLTALGDVPGSAIAERMRQDRSVAHSLAVAPTAVSRVLGLIGVLGGAALLIVFLPAALSIQLSPDQFNLRLILFNLGAIAVVIAVHRRQSFAGRRLALTGAIPALLANAVYLLTILRIIAQPGEMGPGDYGPVFVYGAAAMWLSDLWFGVVTFKLGVLSRWSAAALVLGSIAAFAGMGLFGLQSPGSIAEKVILVGIAIHGLAWVLLGLEVGLRRRSAAVELT